MPGQRLARCAAFPCPRAANPHAPPAPDRKRSRKKVKAGEAAAQGAARHTAGPAIRNSPAHTHISPCGGDGGVAVSRGQQGGRVGGSACARHSAGSHQPACTTPARPHPTSPASAYEVVWVPAPGKEPHRAHEPPRVVCRAGVAAHGAGGRVRRAGMLPVHGRHVAAHPAAARGTAAYPSQGRIRPPTPRGTHPGRSSTQTSASPPRSPAAARPQTAPRRRPATAPHPGP